MFIRTFLSTAFLGVLLSSTALAKPTAIINAHIYTSDTAGEIKSGTILFENGRILAVGSNIALPAEATIIDAAGRIVTPGFVATNTSLGLSEVNSVDETMDSRTTLPTLSAAFDVQYALNPATSLIPVARLGGVTSAIVMPEYGGEDMVIAGNAAAITLGIGTSILLKPRVGMVVDLGEEGGERAGGSRAAELVELRRIFTSVRTYMARKGDFETGNLKELDLSQGDLEALIPVVTGKIPVIASVHRASDIRQAIKLAREFNLKLVINGGEEAWQVADELASASIPVLLNPTSNLPSSFETFGATLENAAHLSKAGVKIAIVGNDAGHRVRDTRYNAGIAVSRGLSYAAALDAITITPARIFGLTDEVGSLTKGKRADLVLWNGDPLEPLSQPQLILINGVAQPLTSRATELRDRYLQ